MSGPFAFQVSMVPVMLNPAGSDPSPVGIGQVVEPGTGVRFALVSTTLGVLADPPAPPSLTFVATDPAGAQHTATPVQDSVGNWHADLMVPTTGPGGIWSAVFSCSSGVISQNAASMPFEFFVDGV